MMIRLAQCNLAKGRYWNQKGRSRKRIEVVVIGLEIAMLTFISSYELSEWCKLTPTEVETKSGRVGRDGWTHSQGNFEIYL